MIMHGWIVLGHTSILTDLSQVNLKGIPIPTTFSTSLSVVWSAAILCPNIPRKDVNIWTNFPVGRLYSFITIHHSIKYQLNDCSVTIQDTQMKVHRLPTSKAQCATWQKCWPRPTSLGYEMQRAPRLQLSPLWK